MSELDTISTAPGNQSQEAQRTAYRPSLSAATGGDIRPALGLMEAVKSVDTQDDYDRHFAGLCLGWILAAANAGVDHYHVQKQTAKGANR